MFLQTEISVFLHISDYVLYWHLVFGVRSRPYYMYTISISQQEEERMVVQSWGFFATKLVVFWKRLWKLCLWQPKQVFSGQNMMFSNPNE